MKMKKTLKQIVSGVLTLTMLSSILPSIPTAAADTSFTYPYTLFAASDSEGAITVNAGNFCVNGNVATNGTIVSSGNMNINGTRTEYAGEDMIYILKKLDYAYFSSDNVETYIDDYSYSETNINITEPLEVGGTLELTGNINLNSGIKAVEDVNINGEVKNSNNAVICSETGDINIYTTNVSFNGLIYAPFGDIVIDSDNLNLNNAILIAQTITLDCPNVNANYNSTMAEIVGTESDTDIELFAIGSYDEDANAIDIEWQSNYGNSTYEIFCSDDNINYTSVATVAGSTEYQYLITEDFEKRYFKVVLTTNYGETIEAIPFVVTKDEYDYYDVELLDSDADELPDVLEIAIGTRTDLADTDGDTLTDYQEVYITGTDPTVYDSVAEGVSDADADCDSDGLSNSYEIELGSDPCSENSDEDDLNDYDEVYIYGTDPTKTDTDDDTISDSSEIKLGLDPNDPQTFGVPDSEYIFSQVIASDSEILSEINTEESPYTLSIELDTNMYAEDEVTAEISGYSKAIENDAMLGNGVDIAISDVCTPENIVIKYTIKDAFLDNTDGTFSSLPEFQGIRRLNVFKLDTETNMLLPIETQFDDDNNVLYAEVDEFGTYCIMDMEIWLKNIGVEYKNYEDEISDITLNIDNINLLSDETSMPKTSYNFKGSTYAVYDITGMSWEEANAYCGSLGGHLVTITTSEEQAFINNNLLTNCANNLYWIGGKQVNSEWKWVTNENFYFTNWASGEPTNTANEYYIHMYGKKGRTDISIGQWNNTFNINDTVSSNFYASSHCGFICEWDDNNSANKTYDIFVPTKWKTITLDGELNAVNLIDTDADSLTDWDEVNTELLVWNDDGSFELPAFSVSTYMVKCSRYNTPIYDFLKYDTPPVKYLPILSDPTEEDSDGDDLYDGQAHYLSAQDFTMPIDPKPLLKTYFPKFGTEEYKQYTEQNYEGVDYQIKHMMSTVNRCKYTDLVSDEDWLRFCEYFNEKILNYGTSKIKNKDYEKIISKYRKAVSYAKKHNVITQDMHYFRLKLNRTPSSFEELYADKDNWILYEKKSTLYHMNNGQFVNSSDSEDSYYTNYNEYNMKFVSTNGMYEVVVTPAKDLSGMDELEIFNYLIKEENWLILTDDYKKAQNNPNFKYDPVNVGTYNYCSYEKKIPGHDTKEDKSLHAIFDILPFRADGGNWGNVSGFIYGNSNDDKDYNDRYYKNNAEKDVYELWWKGKFE